MTKLAPVVFLSLGLLLTTACSEATAPTEAPVEPEFRSRMSVAINLAGAPHVTHVWVSVTAPDLPDVLWTPLTIEGSMATGSAVVRAGPQRTFTLYGIDAQWVVYYKGSATIDVVPGPNPPLTIVMQPTGAAVVPIIAELGS